MVTEDAQVGRAAGPYAALFERYLANGVAVALARVRGGLAGIPEDERQQAWHLLSYALQMPSLWPDTRDLLLALAPKMQMAGFRHDWIPYLEKGLAVSGAVADLCAEAALHIEIGELCRHLGQYGDAESHFAAALALAQHASDGRGEAAALVSLAHLAYLTQKLDDALRLADAVLARVAPDDPMGGRAFFVKGLVLDDRREYEEAERLLRQSQAIWSLANEKRWVALCQQNLARLALKSEQYEESIEAYIGAIGLLMDVGDYANLAAVKMNLGIAYFLHANGEEAIVQYREAEEIYRRFLDRRGQAMVYNNLALVYRERGEWEIAESYFAQSILLWDSLGDTKRRINVEDGLGRLYFKRGESARARDHFRRLLTELEGTTHDREYELLRKDLMGHLAAAEGALWTNAGR